jgi:hypothetical protein
MLLEEEAINVIMSAGIQQPKSKKSATAVSELTQQIVSRGNAVWQRNI